MTEADAELSAPLNPFAPIITALGASGEGWRAQATEDLAALIALGMGVELHLMSSEAQAAVARFLQRAGLDDPNVDPSSAIAAYLSKHPLPRALVAQVGEAARGARVAQVADRAQRGRSALGERSPARPVQGKASDASSLLSLRLRRG